MKFISMGVSDEEYKRMQEYAGQGMSLSDAFRTIYNIPLPRNLDNVDEDIIADFIIKNKLQKVTFGSISSMLGFKANNKSAGRSFTKKINAGVGIYKNLKCDGYNSANVRLYSYKSDEEVNS